MRRIICMLFLLGITVLMAQSLVNPNPPIGEQFFDTYNSISINCKSNNGIVWTAVNNMRSGALKVTFTAQGGGESAYEDVILNNYTSIASGSLGQNNIAGDSYVDYTLSGSATCGYIPSDHVGCIGYIAVSYFGEEAF